MTSARDRFGIIIVMIIITLILVSIVWISAFSSEIQYDINKINSQTQSMQREVQNLEVMIKSASNINNLEARAFELGMVYPDFDQIVYLDAGEPEIVDFAMALKQTLY